MMQIGRAPHLLPETLRNGIVGGNIQLDTRQSAAAKPDADGGNELRTDTLMPAVLCDTDIGDEAVLRLGEDWWVLGDIPEKIADNPPFRLCNIDAITVVPQDRVDVTDVTAATMCRDGKARIKVGVEGHELDPEVADDLEILACRLPNHQIELFKGWMLTHCCRYYTQWSVFVVEYLVESFIDH